MRFLFSLSCLLGLTLIMPARATPELVIIIDDIGNNQILGQRATNLPGPITLAFLPHTPFAPQLAEHASQNNKGIMLHAPMANETGARLGPGALTENMNQVELQETLIDSLDAIPHVQGINNHMGSLLTQDPDAMAWVMEIVKKRGLFFIDSLTNPASVAEEKAKEAGIPTTKRDVFLDNDRDSNAIAQQFEHALTIAQRYGHAVLIGHPYPETLDFLETRLPQLQEDQSITLIRVDHFLAQQQWLKGEFHNQASRLKIQLDGV